MFLDQLSRISNRIDGALALSLVAKDGIPVESVSSDPDLDLEVLAAELVAQARSISENHRELEVGEVQQLAVTTDRLTLMVSSVAADYYLLLVLGPEGSYGRARFELRRARLLLEQDLS
ncbi:MAG TPA: roadblock/LC7 domain-containing protein [Thermoanaerobaculia bacterium]|jgi:predicted regulator of Ras-like GTPase activity (Roadblock/LC7/MglB family)|nr:roadblock/LC7 domain-containing protein [Thermoanaerobaculia bacterium]